MEALLCATQGQFEVLGSFCGIRTFWVQQPPPPAWISCSPPQWFPRLNLLLVLCPPHWGLASCVPRSLLVLAIEVLATAALEGLVAHAVSQRT